MRTLVISDLHLGSGDDLLTSPAALERLEPELQWADQLILLGDVFELIFASLERAVDSSRPLFELIDTNIDEVVYLPGNHDHHLVALAGDQRRFQRVMGQPDLAPFTVPPADQLLAHLCPTVERTTAYPLIELDGVVFTHGHYISHHLRTIGWTLLGHLEWQLAGGSRRQDGLQVADYESLIAPLSQLLYETAQLPNGRHGQLESERLLAIGAALLHAPNRIGQQAFDLGRAALSYYGNDRRRPDPAIEDHPDRTQAVAAIERVCTNLAVPAGKVAFAHTHGPFVDVAGASERWTFSNSGSWIFDRHERMRPHYRAEEWPGTALRMEDGQFELRQMLADCDQDDLYRMLGRKQRRRRGKS